MNLLKIILDLFLNPYFCFIICNNIVIDCLKHDRYSPSSLYELIQIILTKTLGVIYCSYHHFMDEEKKAQKVK